MIPVDQTRFGPIFGDCYRACLASILELPLHSLPANLGWMRELDRPAFFQFFRRFDLAVKILEWRSAEDLPRPWPGPRGFYHLLGGLSPREGLHATVGRDGALVHDPHPSRQGLLPGPGDADILIPLSPIAEEILQRPIRLRARAHPFFLRPPLVRSLRR